MYELIALPLFTWLGWWLRPRYTNWRRRDKNPNLVVDYDSQDFELIWSPADKPLTIKTREGNTPVDLVDKRPWRLRGTGHIMRLIDRATADEFRPVSDERCEYPDVAEKVDSHSARLEVAAARGIRGSSSVNLGGLVKFLFVIGTIFGLIWLVQWVF